jgi:hypothetical protein
LKLTSKKVTFNISIHWHNILNIEGEPIWKVFLANDGCKNIFHHTDLRQNCSAKKISGDMICFIKNSCNYGINQHLLKWDQKCF